MTAVLNQGRRNTFAGRADVASTTVLEALEAGTFAAAYPRAVCHLLPTITRGALGQDGDFYPLVAYQRPLITSARTKLTSTRGPTAPRSSSSSSLRSSRYTSVAAQHNKGGVRSNGEPRTKTNIASVMRASCMMCGFHAPGLRVFFLEGMVCLPTDVFLAAGVTGVWGRPGTERRGIPRVGTHTSLMGGETQSTPG